MREAVETYSSFRLTNNAADGEEGHGLGEEQTAFIRERRAVQESWLELNSEFIAFRKKACARLRRAEVKSHDTKKMKKKSEGMKPPAGRGGKKRRAADEVAAQPRHRAAAAVQPRPGGDEEQALAVGAEAADAGKIARQVAERTPTLMKDSLDEFNAMSTTPELLNFFEEPIFSPDLHRMLADDGETNAVAAGLGTSSSCAGGVGEEGSEQEDEEGEEADDVEQNETAAVDGFADASIVKSSKTKSTKMNKRKMQTAMKMIKIMGRKSNHTKRKRSEAVELIDPRKPKKTKESADGPGKTPRGRPKMAMPTGTKCQQEKLPQLKTRTLKTRAPSALPSSMKKQAAAKQKHMEKKRPSAGKGSRKETKKMNKKGKSHQQAGRSGARGKK
eukprot:g7069.t1